MKHKLISNTGLLGSALILSLIAAPLMAEEADDKMSFRDRVQQYDADGDGQLNEEERTALREARRAYLLDKYDADGDGELNEDERQAKRDAKRDAKRARVVEKFDADGDGELNEEEKQAAREAWSKLKEKRQQFREGSEDV
ncbi:MAG: hypothetical protein AAF410_01605 [Pseudomonadota bacterium]